MAPPSPFYLPRSGACLTISRGLVISLVDRSHLLGLLISRATEVCPQSPLLPCLSMVLNAGRWYGAVGYRVTNVGSSPDFVTFQLHNPGQTLCLPMPHSLPL